MSNLNGISSLNNNNHLVQENKPPIEEFDFLTHSVPIKSVMPSKMKDPVSPSNLLQNKDSVMFKQQTLMQATPLSDVLMTGQLKN